MIELRTANKSDIPAILRIYSYYVSDTAVSFEYEVPSLEAYMQKFESLRDKFPWIVCELDGAVAGYTYAKNYYEDAAYAWSTEISVYVDESCQRKGIATYFYRCMEELLTMQGYCNLYASITGTNEKSLNFHKALGFEEIGRYHKVGYKLGAWHDVVWLEKILRQYPAEPQQPIPFSLLGQDRIDKILADCTEQLDKRIAL